MANARETALLVLVACRRDGAWIDGALKHALRRSGLDARDRALCAQLAYGVTQYRLLLDAHLDRCLKNGVRKTEPLLLDILRLGAYQILCMDRIPVSAAVNEAVEMAKAHRLAHASGMVNGVLRSVARRKGEALSFRDDTQRLSIETSHPRWLVERVTALLGAEEAERFLRANNDPAPMTVQVNPLKTDAAGLLAAWQHEGVSALAHPWLPGCFTVTGTGDLEALESFQCGLFTVQDASARLAALAAAPKPGERVIDVCAAPGGKSFAMAMAMENRGSILSCDMEEHKLRLLELGAQRLGVEILTSRLADGRVNDPALNESADVVLCDVPCSGLGILRKKPDIRWRSAQDAAALPKLQRAILNNASRYVRPGGTLVYSTCTILPEENEGVSHAFLADHPDFTCEAISLDINSDFNVFDELTLWPQRHGADGFYICRMKRRQA